MTVNTIKSPATGVVWRVEAQLGDQLETGAVILLVEAMKMEIPVEMPSAGRLVAVHVAAGDAISEGQELARYES